MNDNVIDFNGMTTLDIPVEKVLNAAKETIKDTAVVIGYDENGLVYFASSVANGAEIMWLLEVAKKRLLED